MLETTTLKDFVFDKNVASTRELGLVHTAKTAQLLSILNQRKLAVMPCNVFKGESLCYLFVGRPAYKYKLEENTTYWMMPTVFVMRFQNIPSIKRIHPFDSGAFVNRLLPQYITMFPLESFNLGVDPAIIGRFLSLFFLDEKSYLRRHVGSLDELKNKFNIGPLEMPIEALIKLYAEHSNAQYDDRSAALEVQIDKDIDLQPSDCIGIVVPEEMTRDYRIKAALESISTNIEIYQIHPVNPDWHFILVYEAVTRIYRSIGMKV